MQTSKSTKPPLSPRRVQLIFGKFLNIVHKHDKYDLLSFVDCVEKRYKEHDHRALMSTLSQKCRDAGRSDSTPGTPK